MAALRLIVLLIVAVNLQIQAQDVDCDYYQDLVMGSTYYVYSPRYSDPYPPGKTCRWQASSPANTVCRLTCPEIDIPPSSGCTQDRLLISRTGDSALTGAVKYCGKGSLNISSTSNRLSIGFISTPSSIGGRFICTLTAENTGPSGNTCQCGWKKQTRIVGGQETKINEYPSMVGLVDVTLRIIYCGAVIISENFVMTAAHCLKSQEISNVAVLCGEHNTKLDDSPATQLIRSGRFITHESYKDGYDYDIGLIQTESPILFSDRVGPACLPFKFALNSFTGASVEALGWGTTSFAGTDSDYLQKVTLQVIDQNTCLNTFPNDVTSRTICTYTSGKDACQHDSGGPLLYQEPSSGRLYVVGIIMGGYGCATSRPGLNSRVTEYLNWITAKTPGVKFCNK